MSVPAAILQVLEVWARTQPAGLPMELAHVEAVFERLDMLSLFEMLMGQCSYRDRKSLSYEGGIRCSPEDLGHTVGYAGTQKCIQADGSEVTVRDPGDKLWGEVFDHLVQFWVYRRRAPADLPQLSDDRKGDLLELLLGAASILLDRGEQVQEASRHLRYCLHLIRLLVEDCARTLEEIHVASHPAGCLLKGQKDGDHITSRHCPRCHQQVFAKWQYATWTGAISALFNHQCSM